MANESAYWLACTLGTVVAYGAGFLVGTHYMERCVCEAEDYVRSELVWRLARLRDQYQSDIMRASMTTILNRFIQEVTWTC